jgi:DNA-binding winged helix-turn-helix (wHTH) protein
MTGSFPLPDHTDYPTAPEGPRPVHTPAAPEQSMQQLFFGDFSAEIDASGCHGLFKGYEPVGLSDLPREVLFILLQYRPRPVSAKALLKELWHPGANPSNVAKQVRSLRLEMGDELDRRYIRTVKKEGYAFVMPVTERHAQNIEPATAAPRKNEVPVSESSMPGVGTNATAPISVTEWGLAKDKLLKDFAGSCLHDLELLKEATEECDKKIQLIAEHKRLKLDGRFPREPIFIPPRGSACDRSSAPNKPDKEMASHTADLVKYCKSNPVVINVGSYATACISVLQSLRRRYGLELRSDLEGLNGRQQILRLYHNEDADFLFAPHAPFLMMGDCGALNYRRVMPIHAYQQTLLQAPWSARGRARRLLVYKDSSAEEQLIAQVGIPASVAPQMIASFETLVANVENLSPGDMVIAWEPFASGLESKHQFRRLAEYRLWVSLYCHKRWQRGSLRNLKDQFRRLFISEWIFCRRNRDWAIECLGVDLKALEFFTAGSGLRPST